jgi:murein DD-endopeptidase MepM/ murein hydrolase activator NlpD
MRRRRVLLLLAVSLVCAWLSYAHAAEFANEFEEYEHYSGTMCKSVPCARKDDKTVKYRVKKGDTVCSIARAYGTTSDKLIEYNNLCEGDIKSGSVLRIPSVRTEKEEKKEEPAKIRFIRRKDIAVAGESLSDNGSFMWPVSGARKVSADGESGVKPIGVVITAKSGARIVSAAPGVVEKVGRMRGFGNFVVVRHSDRLITVYACLDIVSVKKGDALAKGKEVGRLAGKENTFRFMVHRAGKPEDPLKYLPKKEG